MFFQGMRENSSAQELQPFIPFRWDRNPRVTAGPALPGAPERRAELGDDGARLGLGMLRLGLGMLGGSRRGCAGGNPAGSAPPPGAPRRSLPRLPAPTRPKTPLGAFPHRPLLPDGTGVWVTL